MKIESTQVYGFGSALRSMRNPMNSWGKSDSNFFNNDEFVLGKADKELSAKLTKAGSEHCKHLRMIHVWVDMELPRYIWQEMDTYKFNNKVSTSTMHKLFNKDREIVIDDFEYAQEDYDILELIVIRLNNLRKQYLKTKDNALLLRAKKILPESFLQLRTIDFNYQELLNIYNQRKNHKLLIWRVICEWILSLPYFKELTGLDV